MERILTISELENATGIPRSTIHYYVRNGLLPKLQKPGATRALYSEEYVALLKRIGELKASGLSLAQIAVALKESLERASRSGGDLVEQEYERTHQAILRLATESFVEHGYRRTRIDALIRGLGISPAVFYSHFPSKRHLLVECFKTFMEWGVISAESRAAHCPDMVERQLIRTSALLRIHRLGSDVLALVRTESDQTEYDLQRPVEEAWSRVMANIVREIEAMRRPGASMPVSDELLAFSLLGAFENTLNRASWDDRYALLDLLQTHIWLWLSIRAAQSGAVDVSGELARYHQLIADYASAEPLPFAPPEDEAPAPRSSARFDRQYP
jgi:AcrR family transcriptional regulator/predicted DNA-binding transcriptional regulator AlpA